MASANCSSTSRATGLGLPVFPMEFKGGPKCYIPHALTYPDEHGLLGLLGCSALVTRGEVSSGPVSRNGRIQHFHSRSGAFWCYGGGARDKEEERSDRTGGATLYSQPFDGLSARFTSWADTGARGTCSP